jgi:hypothetical protein
VLHAFDPGSGPPGTDGIGAAGGLVQNASGVLFGATRSGGTQYLGTVYELTPPSEVGAPMQYAVIHSFIGMQASDGTIWVGGAQGLYRLDSRSGRHEPSTKLRLAIHCKLE